MTFALWAALAWPAAPPPDAFAAGRALTRDAGVYPPVSAAYRPDLRIIGRWSNGYEPVPVEWALWLTPDVLARWLGYLDGREFWPAGEAEARWGRLGEELGGRWVFVVQLSAFPKQRTYGVGDPAPSRPADVEDVRFVLTSGDETIDLRARPLVSLRSRSRPPLETAPWWEALPFGALLTPEMTADVWRPPLPVGDWYRVWWMVWTDRAPTWGPDWELRVISPRKQRTATFSSDD